MRNRPAHYSRDYRRRRAKADPNYLKAHNERSRAWAAEKVKRCPEYAQGIKLNNRLNKLRELIIARRCRVARTQRELIATERRYNALRERCKGK